MSSAARIKTLIVEDSALAAEELKCLLAPYTDIEIEAHAATLVEAQRALDSIEFDVVFLDLHLPGGNGFSLLENAKQAPHIIVTSAYQEHALEAFSWQVLDYLTKPIDPKRLQKSIVSLRNALSHNASLREPPLDINRAIFVKDGEACHWLRVADILRAESVGNYSRLYTQKNKVMILSSLNGLETSLPCPPFFRASRQWLVNTDDIQRIEDWLTGGLLLFLRDGTTLEVSRRNAARFRQLFAL